MTRRKVRSTDEAMRLHAEWNAALLHNACKVALDLIRAKGTMHTGEVCARLESLGILAPTVPNQAERRWCGALVRMRFFAKTGRKIPRVDRARNTHSGSEPRHEWTLREGVTDAELAEYASFVPMPTTTPASCTEPPRCLAPLSMPMPFDRMAAVEALQYAHGVAAQNSNHRIEVLDKLAAWLAADEGTEANDVGA